MDRKILASLIVAVGVGWGMSWIATRGDAQESASIPTTATIATAKKMPSLVAPLRRDVPGKRFELGSKREVYVPAFFDSEGTTSTQVIVYFHGAAWCIEQCFFDSGLNAVLLSINKTDENDFESMGGLLPGILDQLESRLKTDGITEKPIGPICVASFSGGYSAVRDILRNPQLVDRITDVVLADSLYGPRVEGTENEMDPEAMKPFLDYAMAAAGGKKVFWFTHLFPPLPEHRGNTTTLTASYLIDRVGAERRPASDKNSCGAELLYRADLRGFHVLGYAGMTTQDHFNHLYSIADVLVKTSFRRAVDSKDSESGKSAVKTP